MVDFFDVAKSIAHVSQAAHDARQPEIDRLKAENAFLREALKQHTPYKDWCISPLVCHDRSSCPRDPNCAD